MKDNRSGPPSTPKKNVHVDQHLLRLDQIYGIGLDVVDLSLTPEHRKWQIRTGGPEAARVEKIYRRLRYWFCTNRMIFNDMIEEFDTRVHDITTRQMKSVSFSAKSRLVPLPGHSFDTVQSNDAHVRDSTRREQLQEIMLDIVERNHPSLALQSLQDRQAKTQSTTVATAKGDSEKATKRNSDECVAENRHKRSRSTRGVLDAVELPRNMPIRARPAGCNSESSDGATVVPQQLTTGRTGRSFPSKSNDLSANSSRAELTSGVFSEAQQDSTPFSSQSTIESAFEGRQMEAAILDDTSTRPSSTYDISPDTARFFADTLSHDLQQFDSDSNDSADDFVVSHTSTCLPATKTHVRSTSPPLPPALIRLKDRLKNIWPDLPLFLNNAPFAICWEVTRIALKCDVKLKDLKGLTYNESLQDQTELRKCLRRHPSFTGKTLPEPCNEEVWRAALSTFQTAGGLSISLVLDLNWNSGRNGPIFTVSLQPMKFELGHRLSRRFGSDRFLEINFPSLVAREVPAYVKGIAGANNVIIQWLAGEKHFLTGRRWGAFFTKDTKKTIKDSRTDEESIINMERVYFFAEDGHSFSSGSRVPAVEEVPEVDDRTKTKLCDMLEWAVSCSKNREQPYMKLFSRLALSLSRTQPTVILEPNQIRHQAKDIVSPTGNVMNDGCGRMSPALAKRIRDHLKLKETPSAFQGRFGSAKGVWIVDPSDSHDEIWIETWPSQRKWKCDFDDIHHRTFEVKTPARELKSACINLQFIVLLIARANDANLMRTVISDYLVQSLEEVLQQQRSAMDEPTLFRQWVHDNYAQGCRHGRLRNERMDFLGGVPDEEADRLTYLLDSGFHPMKQKHVQEICWKLARRKCDLLRNKLNIKIPLSTYAYMVPDFTGTLKEGEVHLGFSSKFQAENYSETLLHGMDVLVARAPAHFATDIQRVRCVYRPELSHLKDVVVFSTKGDRSLADLLSGGDFDGDQAWVCWEQKIVENYENAEPAPDPNLLGLGYLSKETKSLADISEACSGETEVAMSEFILENFQFSMQEQLLGFCTVYKEKLCYERERVDGPIANVLSFLVGLLVDQAKQGIVFTLADWHRLRRDLIKHPADLKNPAYKDKKFSGRAPTNHILDVLMFNVAVPKIDKELMALHKAFIEVEAQYFDPVLTKLYNDFGDLAIKENIQVFKQVKQDLTRDLLALGEDWSVVMAETNKEPYPDKVQSLYGRWTSIQPSDSLRAIREMQIYLGSNTLDTDMDYSRWALLKASATFSMFYQKNISLAWTMAGRQLGWIKAMSTRAAASGQPGSVAIVSSMYWALRPDKNLILRAAAKRSALDSECAIMDEVEFDEEGTQVDDA